MVELIHGTTGGKMWVHETRLDEYLARGHKLAGKTAPVSKSGTGAKKKPPKAKE